jgi:hypothetical protein
MSSVSWLVTTDIPEALQFAAYIGEKESFHTTEQSVTSKVELEWLHWWQNLPTQGAAFSDNYRNYMKAHGKGQPDHSGIKPIIEEFAWFPPNFGNLDSHPELQALLRQNWDEFLRTATRPKIEMVEASVALVHKINMRNLAQEGARLKGKSEPEAFHLRVDFVRWPKDYKREISATHLVLGAAYLYDFEGFYNILKTQIFLLA